MKTCILCRKKKPFDQYYKHTEMADGYLGRCKECHKAEIRKNFLRRMADPKWREKERIRQRDKERKKREIKTGIPYGRLVRSKIYDLPWRTRNPEKYKAHCKVNNAIRDGKLNPHPCQVCGSQPAHAHHDDYSKPLDVRWLCPKHHTQHHLEMRRLEQFTRDALNTQPSGH
jgi:hypothetical protein